MTRGGMFAPAFFSAQRRGHPTERFPGWSAVGAPFIAAAPELILIGISCGGVRSGVFTASESSCIAVAHAAGVTALVYRSLSFPAFGEATMAAARTTAMVLPVIGRAASFGWLLACLRAPAQLAAFMQGLTDNPSLILIEVLRLIVGAFMDMSPLIVITTPSFLPVATALRWTRCLSA